MLNDSKGTWPDVMGWHYTWNARLQQPLPIRPAEKVAGSTANTGKGNFTPPADFAYQGV